MNNEILKSIEECEAAIKNANNLVYMADAVIATGKDIAPDNTERLMNEDNEIFDNLDSVINDNISPAEVKKLARDTKKFLKKIMDEDAYQDAMEIIK